MDNIKQKFLLDNSIIFLNHGSFGACPKPIFEDYQNWQLQLEKQPVQFITNIGLKAMNQSKVALSKYINCKTEDIVFVTNPSYAINIIAKGLDLKRGDEILSTNLEYGALDRTWNYYCEKVGAKYIQQEITLPIISKEELIEQFWRGLTPRTKAIFISHITSATGLILPVYEICEKAKKIGLLTIVDGAHVPGHIPLDLSSLSADIYTGACHKWMLTPKGCSFLFVNKEFQDDFDPLLISWGYKSDNPGKSKFLDYHELQGTRDFSAFLTVPKAIHFLEENNWALRAQKCRQLILENHLLIQKSLNSSKISPVNSDFLGQMASFPIKTKDPIKLKNWLYDQFSIEVPILQKGEDIFLRISIQAYNGQNDIDQLLIALDMVKRETTLIE